ncbi:DUF4124 domain-containing protein [Pseudoalteromonas sp. SSDWG2]|uniref:DUF4124 domain-containing protein n=1 Tax=Pseudoalteromonas sp. SSDWG2 TaxID=3139391 RepID=UPI003BACA0E4
MANLHPLKIGVCALCTMISGLSSANTVYYKCQTDEGIVFSQFPCDEKAQEQEVTHSNPKVKAPATDYSKQLSAMERDQKRRNLELQIRSTKHKVVMLRRERSSKTLEQEQRLERLMSDDERKTLSKEVKSNIKNIENRYASRIKQMEQTLVSLEKSLKKFQ